MKDWLLHQLYQMAPLTIFLIMIGSFFIGVFITLIILFEKSKINYIESDKRPWRKRVITGYSGTKPVYDTMYSERFVRFIYGKSKGKTAKLAAMKEIAKI